MDLFDWLFIVAYGSYYVFGLGLWVYVVTWLRSAEGKRSGLNPDAWWLFTYVVLSWPIPVILFVRQEIKDRRADRMT